MYLSARSLNALSSASASAKDAFFSRRVSRFFLPSKLPFTTTPNYAITLSFRANLEFLGKCLLDTISLSHYTDVMHAL